jgi:prephenate dehydrogenase
MMLRRPERTLQAAAVREGVMKVCIYGAGAIGGYLGVQLALAGLHKAAAGNSHLSKQERGTAA